MYRITVRYLNRLNATCWLEVIPLAEDRAHTSGAWRMNQTDDLDVLQHGAQAIRRGIRFPLFAVEWLKLTKIEAGGVDPVLCTPGWKGITIRLFGQTAFRRWARGGITEATTRAIEVTRCADFTHFQLQSKSASFLQIRFGARVSRSKMVEMCGDQVSAQCIERVITKRGRDYPQVVVSDGMPDEAVSDDECKV